MDELVLLRELRDDIDRHCSDPETAALLRARRRLLERAVGPQVVQLRRRRRWPRIAVAAAAATVLAGGVGIAQVVGFGGRGSATPAAAAALDEAATKALGATDPVVGPGQYLHIRTAASNLSGGEDGSYLVTSTREQWVPADAGRAWVQRRGCEHVVRFDDALAASNATRKAESEAACVPEVRRAVGGAFYGSTPGDSWQNPSRAFFASLPRDPRSLLDQIYEDSTGQGRTPDDEAFVFIRDVLSSGFVPGDLRAALFRAATLIPGVDVSSRAATLDGRTGTSIGVVSPDGEFRSELVFDPATGLVIGGKSVFLRPHGSVAAGAIASSTSVTTEVVDSAP